METYSYTLDLANLTVLHTDEDGEKTDLGEYGPPCETVEDLRVLIEELHQGGWFMATECERLLSALPTVDLLVYGEGGSDDMRITLHAHPDGWRWLDANGNDTEVSGGSAVQALDAAIAAWGTSGLNGVPEAFEGIAGWGRA